MTRNFQKLRLGVSITVLFLFAAMKLGSNWPSTWVFCLITATCVLSIVDATSRLGRAVPRPSK